MIKGENEVEVYFLLTGDFDPDEITTKLNLVPTRKNKKGEKGQYSNKLLHSSWVLSSGKVYGEIADVYELSSALIKALAAKSSIISEIVNQYQLSAVLQVVIYLSSNDSISTPAIGFDTDVIKFLDHTKATIDVDVYKNQ